MATLIKTNRDYYLQKLACTPAAGEETTTITYGALQMQKLELAVTGDSGVVTLPTGTGRYRFFVKGCKGVDYQYDATELVDCPLLLARGVDVEVDNLAGLAPLNLHFSARCDNTVVVVEYWPTI